MEKVSDFSGNEFLYTRSLTADEVSSIVAPIDDSASDENAAIMYNQNLCTI